MAGLMTERRIFVGIDGFAGFRHNRRYELRYEELPDGRLRIELDHAPQLQQDVAQVAVQRALFEKWWVASEATR